jgi:hypothetical protein
MKRSPTTQELLNYFDEKDTRVREVPYTIDAQLLNVVAEQLDDVKLRESRESRSRSFPTAPANIDNRGVYHEVIVPSGFVLPEENETLPVVEGLRSAVWVTLAKYDDRLPIPARVEYDPNVDGFVGTNFLLMDVTGSGSGVGDLWDIKTVTPGLLNFPNHVTFWIEGLNSQGPLDILIEGERYPKSAWLSERRNESEQLLVSVDGQVSSRWAWVRIDRISVRNLPSTARMQAWTFPTSPAIVLDKERPYSHPGYRDRLFPRYWEIENSLGLLTEKYFVSNFGGMEYLQSYSTPEALVGVAIEPNTYGMWAASSTKLYYFDRREDMPSDLDVTGLTREPTYGLSIEYDIQRHGTPRAILIRPLSYTRVPLGIEYRYSIKDPDGNSFILLQDGALVPFSGRAGWKLGIPSPVRLALTKTGTYVITLETLDKHGRIAVDSQPYPNLALVPLKEFDLSGVVQEIKGIGFDHLQRLWIWTGTHMLPLKVSYDGFVIDYDNRALYVTDFFEQVRLS